MATITSTVVNLSQTAPKFNILAYTAVPQRPIVGLVIQALTAKLGVPRTNAYYWN